MTTEVQHYKTDPVEEELVVGVALPATEGAGPGPVAVESRPLCAAAAIAAWRGPAVLLPLATAGASCASALESVSLECGAAEASLPVGESTLS